MHPDQAILFSMPAPATQVTIDSSVLHGSTRRTSRTPTPFRRSARVRRSIRRGATPVHAALETQRSVEQQPVSATHADTFLQWAQAAGIVVPKLRPADFDGADSHPQCRWLTVHATQLMLIEPEMSMGAPAAPAGLGVVCKDRNHTPTRHVQACAACRRRRRSRPRRRW